MLTEQQSVTTASTSVMVEGNGRSLSDTAGAADELGPVESVGGLPVISERSSSS